MAKYQIAYACGHGAERQLFGKEQDRQRFVAWAGQYGACDACKTVDKAAQVDAIEAEFGLPGLTGTEKQITWARTVRAGKLAEVGGYFDKLRAALALQNATPEQVEKGETQIAVVLQHLAAQETARYWIDNRDLAAERLVQAAWTAARQ